MPAIAVTVLATAVLVMAAAIFVHEHVLLDGNNNNNVQGPPPADYGSGSMFDVIARRYDLINRVLAVGMDTSWRREMVDVIATSPLVVASSSASSASSSSLSPGPHILDVATGTADVALLLAQRIPHAVIIGVDPSAQMLQVGREKITQTHLDERITLHQRDARVGFGDAVAHPASMDAATMAFGIRNIVEKQQALCHIHAALKPTATFCILEFSEPDESFGLLGAGARWFIRNVIPTVGGILSGKPREYWHLQHSIQDFPTPAEFVRFLQDDVTCDTGTFRVDELRQLNFGSVQLYVLSTVPKPTTTTTTIQETVENGQEQQSAQAA